MSQTWYRLFISHADSARITEALKTVLAGQGYTSYDPFPGGTGTPTGLTDVVKLFVTPPQENRITVLGQFPENLLLDLQNTLGVPIIYGYLTENSGGFALFTKGMRYDDPAAFEPFRRANIPPETLHRAFAGKLAVEAIESDGPPVLAIGAESLPPELQQFAEDKGADPTQVSSLFDKMSDKLFNRMRKQTGATKDEQAQAQALFMGGGQDAWNSLNGQRVRAIISVLDLPDTWRAPSQEAVRDAYQVYRLHQRAPRMALMPGDREAMDAVPNALDYTPVYMGRK